MVGRVLDESGQGVANVRVAVLGADGEHLDTAATTTDGRYVVSSPEPGERTVILEGRDRDRVSEHQAFNTAISHRDFPLRSVTSQRPDDETAAGVAALGVGTGS